MYLKRRRSHYEHERRKEPQNNGNHDSSHRCDHPSISDFKSSNRFQYATFGVRRRACLRYTVSASTEVVLPISERRVHRTLGSADHLRSAVRVEEPESRKLVLEGASGVPPKSPQFPGKLTFGASKPCVCNARRP